ncbi:MAG: peptidoglycan DD-metalloendopeptidase family protein [Caldilineaceae bacterium]
MNKLGFYLHLSLDQNGLWDAIRRVQPPVILIHADTANTLLLEEIRRFRAPDALVIGRLFKDVHTQRQYLESADPAGQGRALAEEILNYNFGLATKRDANGRLLIDAWMGLNEVVPGPASDQFQHDEANTRRLLHNCDLLQTAFQQRLQAADLEGVAFNFGAGNFTQAEHYLEFFPNTLAVSTYLGFHEYGWPSLQPAPGSATSAGLYRRALEGIRAHYGDRHRVVITEAGLTRMYQNATWGDVGWLNQEAPLSEDAYWASLDWYNRQLLQDDYVVGACLYEVGHHGNWASFRHLGQDDEGRPLGIVDRLVALKESPAPPKEEKPVVVTPPATLVIQGTVTHHGQAIAGATVRLMGGQETLGGVRAAASAAVTSVTWTRRIEGFAGSLWNCWQKYVAADVAGLTYAEFKELAPRYNPALQASNGRFQADQSYFLPENRIPAEIVWDRPLAGFSGSLRDCWQAQVENKVVGLSYGDFKAAMTTHNPNVAAEGRLHAEQRYNLPRNSGQTEYAVAATTDSQGRFAFPDLPAGSYQLTVTAPGMEPYATGFSAHQTMTLAVTLQRKAWSILDTGTRAFATRDIGADFVRVHGDEFIVNRRPFRFIGVNIRGLVHYGDAQTLQWTTIGHRRDQLRAAYEMGARVVRLFLPSMHASAAATITRLQETVALTTEFPGLYLLPALSNLYADVPFRIPGDENFYAKIDPHFPADLLKADFFTGGYQQHYLPFVRQVVGAFRSEPRIFAWEIGNELKLNPATGTFVGDPNVAAFIRFMLAAAAEIKASAPDHLTTTGMISTHHAWLHNDELRHQLYGSSHIDFITVHCYNEEYENDDSALARALHKPFILEEAGFGNGYGQDRSGKVQEDMQRWFGLGARGYLQWGFMATSNDIGDGDGDSGMDRTLHADWDALFRTYQARAAALLQETPTWLAPADHDETDATDQTTDQTAAEEDKATFQTGQVVFAQQWLNVRKSAGHKNKLGDDVVGMLAPGASVTITGKAEPRDGLIWWPISGALNTGTAVTGWVAEALPGAPLIGAAAPASRGRRAVPRTHARARGAPETTGQRYAASWINLRRDAGYVGKPADHVLGQIPYGAAITVLGGPVEADGLTWWQVRAPLLDNQVAAGWAAERDPSGLLLLSPTPPPPPTDSDLGTIGATFSTGETVTVVAQLLNLRRTAGYLGQPSDHIVAMLPKGTALTIQGGPQNADELEWWQVHGLDANGQAVNGWAALAGPDGERLLAAATVATSLHVRRPFAERWALSQGWGAWPEFYSAITYDGVPLKGHNGLDFATPVGTPLLAVDQGKVLRVGFEPDGFGNFLLLEHSWGESLYAHMSRIDVLQDAPIQSGQGIGLSGETGKCFGAHVHFGIRIFPYRRTDGWGGFSDPSPFMDPADLVATRAIGRRPEPMAPELPGRRRP